MSRLFCTLLVAPWCLLTSPVTPSVEIGRFMTALHARGQFSGSIIVAAGDRIAYRGAFGSADVQSRRPFTPMTISNVGSVSKQFTAMAVMMLAEQHEIAYDDEVSRWIPELAGSLKGITLRHLLNHTSGIPDIGDLGIDHPRLTNEEVLQRLTKPDVLVSRPGEKYRYSNPNYVLLAVVVERVSGQRFADFMASRIFTPLGMHDTFVYQGSRRDSARTATAYDQFGNRADADDLLAGSSGMYSTVDDLLKWDRVLYTERLVRQPTLAEAFMPGRVSEGASTYGFGWNVGDEHGRQVVWHQGATGGYRALMERRPADRTAIIILTNRGNSKRLEIADAILNILDGKPYVFPKRSIAEALYDTIGTRGIRAAVDAYHSLRAANDATFDFGESELNALGYQLLYGDRRVGDAIEIFELNTLAYPTSSNPFDSLGEAYQVSGNKELAIRSYRRAVQLDRTNLHAVEMLKRLQ
jgi:CubicO group peptidase (beta-lactamase class C family)